MLSDDLKPYIERLQRREISAREVALALGTHESYVCRVLKRMKVVREAIVKKPSTKEINAARAEHRLRVAKTLSVTDAARAAGCSVRTIYRLRSKS